MKVATPHPRPAAAVRHIATVLVAVTALVLTTLAIATPSADAQQTSNPCPQWSIQDVFSDPNSDWDHDRVPNRTELVHGENPCVPVKTTFCQQQPSLCTFRYVAASSACDYGTYWTLDAVNADPTSDWDRDGVSNAKEARNNANPCAHPCPRPTARDFILNPHADWDRDGVTNQNELAYQSDPCTAPPKTIAAPTAPAPQIVYTIISSPPAGYTCPVGFPFYNPTTGYCQTTSTVLGY